VDLIRRVFIADRASREERAPAQPDRLETSDQFYHAVEIGIERLTQTIHSFSDPQVEAQLSYPRFLSVGHLRT
jgi:hypothetical protein